jgi:hypothetical protein
MNGWHRIHGNRIEKMGFIITREVWAGVPVYLTFSDNQSLYKGANFNTARTLTEAKKIIDDILNQELTEDTLGA